MKFASAWAEIAKQNLTLKVAIASLSFCSALLAIVSLKLALREPLVVERSCFNRALKTVDPRRTKEEIEAFVRIALEMRFNTDAKAANEMIANAEVVNRTQEQKELASRQIRQRLVINSVGVEDSDVTVEADRLLTVGSIRSALPMSLKVRVESQERTDSNPYGLILTNVKQAKTESK